MKRVLLSGFLLGFAASAAFGWQSPAAPTAVTVTAPDLVIDVRNGDQQGKLMFKEGELIFESLTDARHSRKWKYADLREVSKKRKEVSVKPFKGSKYSFQFKDNGTRDRIYNMISERILASRHG